MKVLAVSLAFLLIIGLISTSLAENNKEGEKDLVRVRNGYYCPFQQDKCHLHCISIGRKAGYCGNFLKRTCICVMK
ncbi:preprodefensin, putative [Ixodes scapularis]|uniref:Preprodefensin, putative n=1 Tax=Ixodes scapularis TaxID=6945 RepID=B7PPN2_IXOSC|nr:preprodefensin, putative [Ixodes scapularis]|eukprot:XP_002435724.1 preprodefensin, putative [Ixodes scapularis]